MDISIVIVNFNTKELLLACIGSLYASISGISFEIWVVDNASTDGSIEAVKNTYPEVHCVENHRNAGFAKANNQAIMLSSGRYVVLLNSDTVMTPRSLETIIGYMDSNPDVAVCGGQLLNRDGSLQNSIANIPTLATELLNKSLLRRLFPRRYPGKEQRFNAPLEVESIIGACMVVSQKALKQVGLLDEAFFFFLEETDWCLSMKKAGWRVCFHPYARIYHLQGESAKKNPYAARIEYWKSRYIFFRKNYSSSTCILLMLGLLLRLVVSLILQSAASLFSSRCRSRLKTNAKIFMWHLRGCPSSWGIS